MTDQISEDEAALRSHYEEEAADGEGRFFEFIGLPRDATWEQFRQHYDKDGVPDIDRVASDFFRYPPVAKEVRRLKRLKLARYRALTPSVKAMLKDFSRLSKLISEAKTDRDWEEVEALRADVMPRMLEYLDSLTPEERDAELAPLGTPEEFVAGLADDIERIRSRFDTLSARDRKALAGMEDLLEQALASGKITRH